MNLTYGSLFAGAGGVDLGFDRAGWSPLWQIENNPHATKVLRHWWPNSNHYEDVNQADGGELAPVNVIVGGFPCQDVSLAGHRAGLAGNRSGLFYQFTRIVQEMRNATDNTFPSWAIWENVGGLLSTPGALADVYAEWDNVGAVVQEHRFIDSGRSFGVPQRRRRVFGVAGFDPGADSGTQILSVPDSVRRDTLPSPSEGGSVPSSTVHGADIESGTNPVIYASDWSRTLLTSVGSNCEYVVHADGVRRFTPQECERLMGWPDGHTAPAGSDVHRYRLCGNGVTAPAAQWVANRIEAQQ